jgi:hypothetical protein
LPCSSWQALALMTALALLGAPPLAAAAADAGPPPADEATRQRAKAKLGEGVELMKKNDPGAALTRFEEAYALVPSPKILYNFGLAHQALGHKAAALSSYQRFLAGSTDAAPASVARAEQEIATLKGQLGAVHVSCSSAGAAILVDGARAGTAPLVEPVYLEPGEHDLVAELDGRRGAQRIKVAAGATVHQAVEIAAAAPAPPTAPALAAPGGPGGGVLPNGGSTTAVVAPPLVDSGVGSGGGDSARPLYRRPWLWGVVGGAVVAIVVTVLVVGGSSTEYPNPTMGSFPGN